MAQGSFLNALLRKKAVVDDVDNLGLKRCLSAFDLTLMGIGAIIGTGFLYLPALPLPPPLALRWYFRL
jgi:APA family basic amino acid/polyamine antiporter